MSVKFPKREGWNNSKMVVGFPAEHNGHNITCAISIEALQDHFNAGAQNPVTAFLANRSVVEAKAEQLILKGRFESDGSILIGTADI